ncbi:MAG: hypothetical protein ACLP70_22180 [Streptosporangiaceae bacterium]|jgi:hypothetical protein
MINVETTGAGHFRTSRSARQQDSTRPARFRHRDGAAQTWLIGAPQLTLIGAALKNA